MGFLDNVTEKLRRMSENRLEDKIERLIKDTEKAESRFRGEAKKFYIDITNAISKNYYEVLGIGFTSDPKAIRDAYIKMIKKYHPDVSADEAAKEKSEEINEAYSVLKDTDRKLQYDTTFSKGGNKLSQEATAAMSEALLRKYVEIRNKEFDEFNKRVSVPQQRDAIRAAIDEVLDWRNRFNRASSATFGPLQDMCTAIKKLGSANRSMLKHKLSEANYDKLSRNAMKLASLAQSAGEINNGINSIADLVKARVKSDEDKVAQKLRNAV